MLSPHAPAESNRVPITDDVIVDVQSQLEDHPLLTEEAVDKDRQALVKPPDKAAAPAPANKVLFLDGVRGLAVIMVVTQHSHEYMQDLDLGAVAVDMFFVLSSFLLTWLFMKKSFRMLHEKADIRKWLFALTDYFSKRFWRVYPLFVITCIVLWFMSDEDRQRYYLSGAETFDLYKTLTFDFDHRYFVFWTLPLEISYYFFIPAFVLITLSLRRFWWVLYIPTYYFVITQGWNEYRTSHSTLGPHIPTFLAGSMAAVIYYKLDMYITERNFQFRCIHKLVLRVVEYVALAIFLSLAFLGLFFIWVHENPAPSTPGFRFVSVLVTIVFVSELLVPSPLSSILEWSLLRYIGKISFSVYLLHGFIVYNRVLSSQSNYYCRLFSRFALITLLATISYNVFEYPFQLLAHRITKALNEQETKGSGGWTVLLGENANPLKMMLTKRLEIPRSYSTAHLDGKPHTSKRVWIHLRNPTPASMQSHELE